MKDLVLKSSADGSLTTEQVQTLKTAGIVPQNTPLDQVLVFAHICKERQLSPFSKEIYLVEYNGKYTPITGVNGFRKIADRTGVFAGSDDPQFDLQPSGTFRTIAQYKAGEMPTTCTVTVYKMVQGIRCPFTATVRFNEFNTGVQKWKTMPFQMIAKTAETHAIRKGFADVTGGLHEESELGAIQGQTIEKTVFDPQQLETLIRDEVATATTLTQLGRTYEAHAAFIKEHKLDGIFAAKKAEIKALTNA